MSLVYHSYVTRIYSYVIRMSLVCPLYSLCHPYITRLYSHVIRMSLVCTRMTFVCHSFVVLLWIEVKDFYQSFLGNEVDFTDIMIASPNILAKNKNFKKLRNAFVDERAVITTSLTSFCPWKDFVPFWLRNKRREKAFLTLTVN